MIPYLASSIFIFVFGLFVGSFLNLLIDRLPRSEQIWIGRSHCDKCKKNLLWYDLMPVASWLILRGRCRFCRSPIPFRNTLVELVTGILFVLSYHYSFRQYPLVNYELRITSYELWISLCLNFSILSCLIVIFFVDLKHQIIPDKMIVVGIAASLLLFLTRNSSFITYNYFLSAFGAGVFFLLLYFITKGRGMGFGDVKLALFLGLFLGFPKTFYALYIAFLTGAFISVILILAKKKKFGQTIAFGPFLVFGTIISYFINFNFYVFF